MKRLAVTMLLATSLLAAGCAVQVGGPTTISDRDQIERERCEGQRGAGVWVAAVGACIRGGGSG